MGTILLILAASMALVALMLIVVAMWRHPNMPRVDRLALGLTAAGIIWGGANRAREAVLGLGDVLLLIGLTLILWRFIVYNPYVPEVGR